MATDSAGTISSALPANLAVDTGFTVSPPAIPASLTPNWGTLQVPYRYPNGWTGCGHTDGAYIGPTNVELRVDGKVWQDSPVTPAWMGADGSGNCLVPAIGNTALAAKPLPYGVHNLTWVVTDDAGFQESASQQVVVGLPLTATWPTGSETLTAGGTVTATASVSSPDGVSKLQSWTITDQNGKQLATGTGATAPTVSLSTPVAQETGGTIHLHLVSDAGLTADESFDYQTGWATAAYSHVSARSVKRGSYVSLYASDWVRVNGNWTFDVPDQATVQYQWEVPGSNVWHNGPLVHIAGPQVVRPPAAQMRVGGNVCFRSVYTQTNPLVTSFGSTLIPATSAPVCVTAH